MLTFFVIGCYRRGMNRLLWRASRACPCASAGDGPGGDAEHLTGPMGGGLAGSRLSGRRHLLASIKHKLHSRRTLTT